MPSMVTFPDPRAVVIPLLRELLAEREEPFAAGAEVSHRDVPDGENAPRPYVRVVSDGRSRSSNLNGSATVRVVVWHETEEDAEALAGLIEALLLEARSPLLRGCGPLSGPLTVGDPDTGEPMSAITVTARLRPLNLN